MNTSPSQTTVEKEIQFSLKFNRNILIFNRFFFFFRICIKNPKLDFGLKSARTRRVLISILSQAN